MSFRINKCNKYLKFVFLTCLCQMILFFKTNFIQNMKNFGKKCNYRLTEAIRNMNSSLKYDRKKVYEPSWRNNIMWWGFGQLYMTNTEVAILISFLQTWTNNFFLTFFWYHPKKIQKERSQINRFFSFDCLKESWIANCCNTFIKQDRYFKAKPLLHCMTVWRWGKNLLNVIS